MNLPDHSIVAYVVHYGEKLGMQKRKEAMTHYLTTMPTLGTTENGAEIKMRRTLPMREGWVPAEIVLCHLPWNKVTPFATWQANTTQFVGPYWGHYFGPDEADQAVEDFGKRGRH